MHSLQVSFQYWTAILDGKNVWCCHMVVNFKPIENELGMWVIHGHTMSYCNFWTYPIGEFVLVAINWRNQLKGDLVIVRGHAIATALWPYGTASWNPESSRFHIFSNLFHLVLLVTVDFPDDVGWFACLSLPAINAVTAGPGAKNLFLDLHKRGVFLSSTSLAKDHQNFTVFKWCFFNDGYIHPICPG